MTGDKDYTRNILKRSAAQVMCNIGWHNSTLTSLDVLVHATEKYILKLATRCHLYAEHDGRNQSQLSDLSLAFQDMGLRLPELRHYLLQVPSSPSRLEPPIYPIPRPSQLRFLKPGSREILTRPTHIPEYLPPIKPDCEEDRFRPDPIPDASSPERPAIDVPDPFKRPADPSSPFRKPKTRFDSEDFKSREITSVMMTSSGFLSPAREGRLPEARTPLVPDLPPEKPARPPFRPVSGDRSYPTSSRSTDVRESKKSKPVNGKPERSKRKTKSRANVRGAPKKKTSDVPADKLAAHLARGKSGPSAPAPIVPFSRATESPPRPPEMTPSDLIPPRMIKREIEDREPLPEPFPSERFEPPPVEFPFRIPKLEPPDPEKLTSTPDKSKLTIFKKISVKNREERAPDFPLETSVSRGPSAFLPESRSDDPVVPAKKERKRKEKKSKSTKATDRESAKMLKKQKKEEALRLAATVLEPVTGLSSDFPPYPMLPAPGLIPPGGLFPPFLNNPMLQKMMQGNGPNLLSDPFSPGDLASHFLPSAPGLIPPPIVNPILNRINHGFGQPPQMPQYPNLPAFLRRPSLEVIPLDEVDVSRPSGEPAVSPPLVIRDKDEFRKYENRFEGDAPNVFPNFDGPARASGLKSEMPNVSPDITIELNSPDGTKSSERDAVEDDAPPHFAKEKSEKKKDKLHKKEKKDREQKIKKKKDKKDKLRLKLEKRKDKEDRHDLKEKLKKEKKEKRKEKERVSSTTEGVIPKLTLKLGSSSPMVPSSPEQTRKLNIKPIVKKDPSPIPEQAPPRSSEEFDESERSHSPELARISALVTRPPKSKSFIKHSIKTEPSDPGDDASSPMQSDPPLSRKHRPPSSSSSTKYKRIFFKPIPKRSSDLDESAIDTEMSEIPPNEPVVNTIPPNIPLGTPFYMDSHGNKIWICPACGHPDNGSPMIGCDGCDGWYHWICVGIHVAPDDSEDWYCTSCIAKRAAMVSALAGGLPGKKRGRKPKSEKSKDGQ